MVQDQVPIRFGGNFRNCLHKPLAVTKTYLVRYGAKLQRVATLPKHYTVVIVERYGPLAFTLIVHVLHKVYYS